MTFLGQQYFSFFLHYVSVWGIIANRNQRQKENKMMIKAILFDLDGTLLPMDQEQFIKGYFKTLSETLAPHGYEPKMLIQGIMGGVDAMVKNNGKQSNEVVFWKTFAQYCKRTVTTDMPLFESYYQNEFNCLQSICGIQPAAQVVVDWVKRNGYLLVLATNPIFPKIATLNRIYWAGIDASAFTYITTYENIGFCKPNPEYYLDIAHQIGCKPEECLMIGNDVKEDMVAKDLGMHVFLLTDCLINSEKKDISIYPHGDFEALMQYLNHLNEE